MPVQEKYLTENPNQTRRKVLGSATALSVAGSVWQKPFIDAVVLPAHAQTSIVAQASAMVSSNFDLDGDDDESLDGLCVIFDGESLNLVEFACCGEEEFPDTDGDCVVTLDLDRTISIMDEECNGPALDTFNEEEPGRLGDTNWSVTGPEEDDLPAGTYIFIATRLNAPGAGDRYQVAVTVSFSNIQTNDNVDCNDEPLISSATMTADVVVSAL